MSAATDRTAHSVIPGCTGLEQNQGHLPPRVVQPRRPLQMTTRVHRVGTVLAGVLLALAGLDATADAPANGEWPMAAGDYANTRFSPLAEINRGNAKNLKL